MAGECRAPRRQRLCWRAAPGVLESRPPQEQEPQQGGQRRGGHAAPAQSAWSWQVQVQVRWQVRWQVRVRQGGCHGLHVARARNL